MKNNPKFTRCNRYFIFGWLEDVFDGSFPRWLRIALTPRASILRKPVPFSCSVFWF